MRNYRRLVLTRVGHGGLAKEGDHWPLTWAWRLAASQIRADGGLLNEWASGGSYDAQRDGATGDADARADALGFRP